MQFQMMSEKEMAEALKYLRENEEDDMLRLKVIEKNLNETEDRQQLITKEEAILAASMPGIQYGDKVMSSGDVNHDELFRTLEKSKEIYRDAIRDLVKERNELEDNIQLYNKIRGCINKVHRELRVYLEKYYIANVTAEEACRNMNICRALLFKQAQKALTILTRIYNLSLDD